MRRLALPILIAACLAALVSACFGRVLFRGEQFSFRDAGMYYYPLYHRVQAEWAAGRWPLWDDGENAGMPLLGNPTAAVLYPPKLLIFGALPYPTAVRIYAVAHVVLAFGGMMALLRGWGVSPAGAAVGGLGYAFSGPVLSMSCNIIYLVGAGWIPWGLRAVDRWVREGRRDGPPWLAAALAMMVLGGDPEGAYLIGLCAGGYALGLAWAGSMSRSRARSIAIAAGVLAAFWGLAAVESSHRLALYEASTRPDGMPGPADISSPLALLARAGAVVALVVAGWRGRKSEASSRLLGLAGAAFLAALMAGAQLVPVAEFMAQTDRAARVNEQHEAFDLSIEPQYLPGLAWPNVAGGIHRGSRAWMDAILDLNGTNLQWFPSLYPGALVLVLGLGAMGFRGGPAWRGWLTAMAAVGLVVALGKFGGPLWWIRWIPGVSGRLGPHDPPDMAAFRADGRWPDAWGSPYWAMAHALPGFGQFRFPAKAFPIALAGLAGLAGLGWDQLATGRSGRAARIAAVLLAVTLVGLASAVAFRWPIIGLIAAKAFRSGPMGPLDPAGSFAEIRDGLTHAAVALALAIGLAWAARSRIGPGRVAAVALIGLTLDLALANAPAVVSAPQATFDAKPEAAGVIEEAERRDPSPGPFRIHRLPLWNPGEWMRRTAPDRLSTMVRWEADTLMPKYGLLWGLEYAETFGVAEVNEYHWFFAPFRRAVDAGGAEMLGIEPGRRIVVAPRRGFDLWNARYFILPTRPDGWADATRGYASLLEGTDQIYPPPEAFRGPDGARRMEDYVERRDFQVLRNRDAFPRAWVVHDARFVEPLAGRPEADAARDLLEMLYRGDKIWNIPGRPVEDLRRVARLDRADRTTPGVNLSKGPTLPTETPIITHHEPGRVEIDVTMRSPGLVILSDLYYPGWHLTIDGREAPILRANYLMRGAAVGEGRHRLVYTYRPASFRAGAAASILGLLGFAGLLIRAGRAGRAG
ncbi:hypothetical protein TA3x_004211 [Tundrisphaera sp. TA3]|uniref:hypothetical protein n=1 Tax=Tundrisphaera sp. TA3 TaxID=3435775 RepID=UPI003EBD09EF